MILIVRNILDFIVGLNPASPPISPSAEEDFQPPSPTAINYDAHYGYSPTPSPPPEVANQLTQEQTDMGMYKVEPGTGTQLQPVPGNMGPPQIVGREESVDIFKGRGAVGSQAGAARGSRTQTILPPNPRRKRKDRESDAEENIAPSGRKKTRG